MIEDKAKGDGKRFSIVGVGASAGGLESLEELFRGMPSLPGAAFVVVQHLSPDFKSLMGELMSRFTTLPIHRASDELEVLPDNIYLLPPGKELELRNGRLRVFDRDPRAALTLPINRFLGSLAEDAGERGIAVILSGSGSDGSLGAKRVHEAGGLVLVENPETARFDGMPRAALTVADLVLPADALAAAILARSVGEGGGSSVDDEEKLGRTMLLLRGSLGIDFAQYKLPTVLRRIQRRAALRQAVSFDDYLELLSTDPEELAALGHDLLIGVTRFYRDPATWEILENRVFPQLVRDAAVPGAVRAWVAGCATGEEAYSVAMSLLDACRERPGLGVKVFATDVHKRALEQAGQGIYDAERLQNVAVERRNRYFLPRADGTFQVSQELRHAVIFAQHNVLKDAPFTQLDLVSCRNLLIYFRPPAQRQALSLLQYGLRIGGVLFLGPSENLGEFLSEYDALDEPHRVFVKRRALRRVPDLGVARPPVTPVRASVATVESSLMSLYDDVLNHVMQPSLLIDAERHLIDSFAGAEKLLRMRSRRASTDLVQLVPETARTAVAGGIARASRERRSVRLDSIRWEANEETALVSLTIVPFVGPSRPRAYLVTIERTESASHAQRHEPASVDTATLDAERYLSLEQELKQTKENLQATVEELETSSEEMQATNEELVASNEELQSTNEELHSVNEELHTVNSELQTKNRDLSDLNRDMQLLFESIDSAIVFLDGELRIRRFTPRAAELFGLLEHDIGRPLSSFRHPLKRASLMEDIHVCLSERKPFEYETADVHGGTHLVRIKSYLDGSGESGVILSVTDLTALASARRRADLLSSIVESSADAILGFDERRIITNWNAAAVRLYGYSESEAVGLSFDHLVPPELRAQFNDTLVHVWAGKMASFETVRVHRDGTRIDIASTLSPVRDPDGKVIGVSKIDRDIRERKRREAALSEREQRLSDLYENSPDMFMSFELQSGCITDFNETLVRTLGFTRAELERMHAVELYPPEERERVRQLTDELRQAGELRDIQMVMRKRDGGRLEVSVSSTGVRDARGEVQRSRTVIRDDAARRQAQRVVEQSAKLRERFLAIVSHELRTPLYATTSAAALLANPAANADIRQRAIDVLSRQTTQMTRLLDDLLDVSRISENRMHLVRAPLDLREPIRAGVEACSGSYTVKHVKLLQELPPHAMPLAGDGARLQQVICNLLNNALRYTPAGGRVLVRAEQLDDRARVSVTDSGEGISREQLETIFERFGKADRVTTSGSGLGVGLALARGIIEAHGGSIRAESEGMGRGACFTFELPLSAAVRLENVTRIESGKLRTVVIEDQPDSLEMIALLLETRGHTVTQAGTGRAGLEAILRERPDVALVDIGLPDIDGYAVAKEVRARLGKTVPLIALTGYGQPEDIERSRKAGFDLHLTKPLNPDDLELAIHGVMTAPESASD